MVCDYFFPKVGGVESHIYLLAQTLIQRGHKVVIITHAHPPNRQSIRYLSQGLKVYHVPFRVIPPSSAHATLPQVFLAFPLLRQIFIRERIQVVHAHVALSALGLEAVVHARTMGLKAVFTDHSLLGLGGFGEMWGNKMLKACLSDIEAVICVSHTGKENTVIRAALDPEIVHVLPSAVVATEFNPVPANFDNPTEIVIVCMSRLVYRKGIDLLIGAIPVICAAFPNVRFVIGGDGPKMVELEQMRERHQILLLDRVELLGSVKHGDVKDVLKRGHIFLNTALTEAFGIGLLEAACCGLFVVSTRVGGVPEVLPDDLIELAEPDVADVVRAIKYAVHHISAGRHHPSETHDRVKEMYTWQDVALRTETIYRQALLVPQKDIIDRWARYYTCGAVFGKIMCMVIAVDFLFLLVLEFFWPTEGIDIAVDFDQARYKEVQITNAPASALRKEYFRELKGTLKQLQALQSGSSLEPKGTS